ncbi:MAG TPA: hypothetical protein VGH28_25840 [Polyangiaceae bacterium]|jgi:hypothetical protein
MALKNLTSAEMIMISTPWTTAKDPAHTLLGGIDEVKGLAARLKTAHQKLLLAQEPAKNPNAAKLAEISTREVAIDTRHDQVIRGIYGVLGSLAELAPDPAARAPYLAARDSLVPNGLSKATQTSYRDEAGQSKLVDQRAEAHKDLLGKIKTPLGTLVDALDEWKDLGKKLGQAEDERVKLEGMPVENTVKSVDARNAWIKAVNALLANLDLAEISDETRQTLLGPLEDALQKADRRGTKKAAAGQTTTPPVTTAPGTVPTTAEPAESDPTKT